MVPLREMGGHIVRCQNRQRERDRREISEEVRNSRTDNQQQRKIGRQNSENRLEVQPNPGKEEKKENHGKQNKGKIKNFIEKEQIRPFTNPIPISVQIAMKKKDEELGKQHDPKHGHPKYK
jgi:hypothetical protein